MQTATKVAVTVRTVFSAVSSGVTCVLRSRYQGRVKAAGVTADLDPPPFADLDPPTKLSF